MDQVRKTRNDHCLACSIGDVPPIVATQNLSWATSLGVAASDIKVMMPSSWFRGWVEIWATTYMVVMKKIVKPYPDANYAQGCKQQDGAPVHKAHAVQEWCRAELGNL